MSPTISFDIHRFKEANSTNAVLKDMARQGASIGTVVVADLQTQGKGRGKRTWHSPSGGLYFSVLLKAASVSRAADLSLLAGVAVVNAIKECLPKNCDVTVKWPNDCLLNQKKVAGILCESVDDSGLVVVGIGININTSAKDLAAFSTNAFPATSFVCELGQGNFDLTKTLDIVLQKIKGIFELYLSEGFESIRFLWEKNCSFVGKRVEFQESVADNTDAKSQKHVGQFVGIDPNGAIVLATPSGEMVRFYSGEITCYWPST